MPTIFSHPAVAIAFKPAFDRWKLDRTTFAVGILCSILPDLDVLGFGFGIRYGDLLGHRGLTHSILFAVAISLFSTLALRARRQDIPWAPLFGFLFLCSISHGILDAFTDGGLGIAFFSPFSNTRYFFPWRPIRVSPIGFSNFIHRRGIEVLQSEILFVWIPSVLIAILFRLFLRKKSESNP
jgi:inner membrane protein